MDAIANMAIDKGKALMNLEDNLSRLSTKLKRLSCRALDYKQEVTKAEQTGTRKRKREVENWFVEVQQVENDFDELERGIKGDGILKNLSSGDRVSKLEGRVDDLMEQSNDFNGCLVIDDPEYRGEPRVAPRLFGDMFHEGLTALEDWLVKDDIFNIGIYGPGGVGKTTLAQHIHNRLLETTYFKVLWVTVSQEFSVKKLQQDIAKLVQLDLSHEEDEDRRAFMLSKSLVQNCLLILDDVWEEFCTEKIGIALGTNRCRMILTTRSLELCQKMKCQKKLNMKSLNTDEAWDLFIHKLGPETVFSDEVEMIAKSVAKRCAGLPLGIVVVAGSMTGVIDICEWRNALDQLNASSIGYEEMENKVFPILEWSFNRLNECERYCFLYMCLYPEDYYLKKERLVNLFISAELFPRRNTRESELDYGHKILNKLVRVSLVEEKKAKHLDEGLVKLHDIIRDMARRITCGKWTSKITGDVPRFLVRNIGILKWQLDPLEWNENLNAVSFARHFSTPTDGFIEIPRGMSPKCPNLSTILFRCAKLKKIPDSFFVHMYGLKVLNLENCDDLHGLPECISDLVNLNALLLRRCYNLKAVPPLGKLKKLRELDLSYTLIDDLPHGFEKLVNLEHFWMIGERFRSMTLRRGTFSEFQHLRQLVSPWVLFSSDQNLWKQLQVFGGWFSFSDFFDQLIKFHCWPKRYNISVVGTQYPEHLEFSFGALFREEVNVLNFWTCNLPSELDVGFLPEDVGQLMFYDCSGLSNVFLQGVVDRFKDLSALRISGSEEVQFLLSLSNYACPMQNLEVLYLFRLPNFLGLVNFGSSTSPLEASHFRGHQQEQIPPGIFSSLHTLIISECHKLNMVFPTQSLLQNLQNLETFHVSDCEQLEYMVAKDDHLEREQVRLPKLRLINLHNLPRLENICETTMICDSIEYICLVDCIKLKRLPLFIPINPTTGEPSPPKYLQGIWARDDEWWDSLEWEHPKAKDVLQPFFCKLSGFGVGGQMVCL